MSDPSHGFKPLESNGSTVPINLVDGDNEFGKKTAPQETPKVLDLRKKLSQLVSRHPKLQLRSNLKLLETLNSLDEDTLDNMLNNAKSDLTEIDGTPGAELILEGVAGMVDTYFIPGFLEECLEDEKLCQEIEMEFQDMVGLAGHGFSIPMRMMAAAVKANKKRSREGAATTTGNASKTYNPKTKNGEPSGSKPNYSESNTNSQHTNTEDTEPRSKKSKSVSFEFPTTTATTYY